MTDRLLPALLGLLLLWLRRWFIGQVETNRETAPTSTGNKAELTLIEAAEAGELEMVEKLRLRCRRQRTGRRPKHRAAPRRARGACRSGPRLIEAGADINAKDDIDQTPGDRARFWKQDKVLELLDSNSILEAAREPTVLAQLESGVNVNHANASGDTALTYAAFIGHAEVVALLIEKEANVNASGLAGWTALHLAAQRGHEKIVEQLIANGAEINALTDEGFRGRRSMCRCQAGGIAPETRGKDRRCAEVMPLAKPMGVNGAVPGSLAESNQS